jgi:hypothetical protein
MYSRGRKYIFTTLARKELFYSSKTVSKVAFYSLKSKEEQIKTLQEGGKRLDAENGRPGFVACLGGGLCPAVDCCGLR